MVYLYQGTYTPPYLLNSAILMCSVDVKNLGPKAQETFMWKKSLDLDVALWSARTHTKDVCRVSSETLYS